MYTGVACDVGTCGMAVREPPLRCFTLLRAAACSPTLGRLQGMCFWHRMHAMHTTYACRAPQICVHASQAPEQRTLGLNTRTPQLTSTLPCKTRTRHTLTLRCNFTPRSRTRTCSALLRDPDIPWGAVPDLPKAAAAALEQHFARLTSRVVRVQHSAGGDTTKLLLELQDGMQVEAVVMHYDTSERYAAREQHSECSDPHDHHHEQQHQQQHQTPQQEQQHQQQLEQQQEEQQLQQQAQPKMQQQEQQHKQQQEEELEDEEEVWHDAADDEQQAQQQRGRQQVHATTSGKDDSSTRSAACNGGAGWGNKRGTLCVSSQVGCQMGCTFCATGEEVFPCLISFCG